MSDIVQGNLGPVTAYAYAKAGGYTGTEEEFQALMAANVEAAKYADEVRAAAAAANEDKEAAAESKDAAAASQADAATSKAAAETAANYARTYTGAPRVAATAAAMTDQSLIYVYTGSETGYTAGNWYFWDGTTWTSGGVYNSTALETDETLTVSGAAADAKVTGDEIGALKSAIKQSTGTAIITGWSDRTSQLAIVTNVGVGNTVNLTPVDAGTNISYVVLDVSEGDKFTITGTCANTYRLWCFIDSSNAVLAVSDASINVSNLVITAPENSAKLILQVINNTIPVSYIGESIVKQITRINTNQNDYNAINLSADLINELTITGAIKVNGEDDDNSTYSGYRRSRYIKVYKGWSISFGTMRTPATHCIVAFYDDNMNFVSGITGTGSASTGAMDFLENGYIRISSRLSTITAPSFCVVKTQLSNKFDNIITDILGTKYLNKNVHTPLALIDGVEKFPGNLIIPEECEAGYIDYQNGTVKTDLSGYFCTGFIPVTAGETYKSTRIRNYAYYNSSKIYQNGSNVTTNNLTIPTDISYLRFSVRTSEFPTPFDVYFAHENDYDITVTIPNLVTSGTWCTGKTINWIGDSIVAGEDFDEKVCEALGLLKPTEYGINGSTIALKGDGTDERNAICERYVNMSNTADMIAVSAGTNDWMYAWCPIGSIDDPDDGTSNTTFYGALKTLCKGLIDKYPQKTIFFTTPIKRAQSFERGNGGEYTADGVMTTPFSKNKYGKTLMDYADIIIEVCGYYSIPVLDMYRESMLNPHITAQQNLFDSALTHPNTAGQAIMARRVAGWITQLGYNI